MFTFCAPRNRIEYRAFINRKQRRTQRVSHPPGRGLAHPQSLGQAHRGQTFIRLQYKPHALQPDTVLRRSHNVSTGTRISNEVYGPILWNRKTDRQNQTSTRRPLVHLHETDNGADLVRGNRSQSIVAASSGSRNNEGRSTLSGSAIRTRTIYERATEFHRCR